MSIKIRNNLNRLKSKSKSKAQENTMYSLKMWQSHLAALAKVSRAEEEVPQANFRHQDIDSTNLESTSATFEQQPNRD